MKKSYLVLLFGLLTLFSAKADNAATLKKGAEAPDFTAADTLGNSISLSDYKGKYVVLDFWASWCGDCRREIPYLKEVYSRFKDAKLGKEQAPVAFLSISFDHKKEAWTSLLRKEMFGWPQISNLKPWKENPISIAYDLHWIPTFYVVSPKGRIVGGAITAKELEKILLPLITKKPSTHTDKP